MSLGAVGGGATSTVVGQMLPTGKQKGLVITSRVALKESAN